MSPRSAVQQVEAAAVGGCASGVVPLGPPRTLTSHAVGEPAAKALGMKEMLSVSDPSAENEASAQLTQRVAQTLPSKRHAVRWAMTASARKPAPHRNRSS